MLLKSLLDPSLWDVRPFDLMQWTGECVANVTDQGWEPKPYHASWRIWKPRPSRIVFLLPMDRISIPNTTVCRNTGHTAHLSGSIK